MNKAASSCKHLYLKQMKAPATLFLVLFWSGFHPMSQATVLDLRQVLAVTAGLV